MIRIEATAKVITKAGTSKAGKPYSIREQVCYAHLLDDDGKPGKYPQLCHLSLSDDQDAYAPGDYMLDPRSVIVGDFHALGLKRIALTRPGQNAPK